MTTISAAEPSRRDFLYVATAAAGAVGAAATLAPRVCAGKVRVGETAPANA